MDNEQGRRGTKREAPQHRKPKMRVGEQKAPRCVKEPLLMEEVLHVDPKFIGRIFTVEVQKVLLPDGRATTREVVRHPGGACVVALDDDRNIYLVHQYRVGTSGPLREIPAGKLEPPEDALTCARRELAEETGFTADRWELLTRFHPSPGYTDEVIHIYLARGLTKGRARPDEGEFIACETISLRQAIDEILDGTLTDGKTCLGVMLAAARIAQQP